MDPVTLNGQPLQRARRCEKTGKVMYEKPEAISRAAELREQGCTAMGHYYGKCCGTWHIGNDRRKRR